MKTIDDIRLEIEISDLILGLIDDDLANELSRGDLQGVVTATAMNIVTLVRDRTVL
jgi:hypothetical protein